MKECCYILLLAIALLAGSCAEDDHVVCPEPVRILLVYVATDNNLSGLEQAKLQAIRDGMTGKATDRIIVYRDTKNAPARLMELERHGVREIAVYGTENSASPEIFSHVVNDVKAMFPADIYGLLVFSHASGWLPEGVYNAFNAGNYDDTKLTAAPYSRSVIIDGADEMELADFATAIPEAFFDYIVFEACFMAGIEVAYELREKAPVIFASSAEIVHPGFEPAYPSALPKLFAGDIPAFGQSVFSQVLTYADDNPQRSATYSMIQTAGLDALASFVRGNCDFSRGVETTDVQRFDRLKGNRLFFDFGDYYGRLLDTDAQRSELALLIDACVSWKSATPEFMTQSSGLNGFAIAEHSGLTAYIPQTALPGLNAAYGGLGWTQATR